MKAYYDDGRIQIFHGRAEDVLPSLPSSSVALSFNDPPYFRVKREYWDRQWNSVKGFLTWLESLTVELRRVIQPNGSLYVCASPDRSHDVEALIKRSFNVLNNIRWLKEDGWHKKADKETLRSYLSNWETIIFAEQIWGDDSAEKDMGYYSQCKALHKNVYAPLGRYIQIERERCGLSQNEVDVSLGHIEKKNPEKGSRLIQRWEEGSSLPTESTYKKLRELLNHRGNGNGPFLTREYEDLRREYEDLRRDYEDLRRSFSVVAQHLDTWFYDPVKDYPGKHICEKPIAMLLDVIETSTRPDDTVLDCFCGSGVTLEAAKRLGRKAIGIDVDLKWVKRSAHRVSQFALPFGPEPEQMSWIDPVAPDGDDAGA